MKHWLFVATFVALSAYADSEGEQIYGAPVCPLGMDGIRFFIGNRHLATVCMAKAELERAQYIAGPDKGMVACQTLVVKGR